MRKNPYYLNTYIIVNFFVMTVAPVVILCVCHYQTFQKIRENTRMHNAISSHQVECETSPKKSYIFDPAIKDAKFLLTSKDVLLYGRMQTERSSLN